MDKLLDLRMVHMRLMELLNQRTHQLLHIDLSNIKP